MAAFLSPDFLFLDINCIIYISTRLYLKSADATAHRIVLQWNMALGDFMEALERNRAFQLQVAAKKYIPPVERRYAELKVDERLKAVLDGEGIAQFYSHQAEAVESLRKGRSVVLMTPTASGKSLVYNIPVLESVIEDPLTRALYIFPLKGLEQDQLRNLNELSLSLGLAGVGGVYDGDTPTHKRRKIRESLPNVLFTNPDMLHLGILPFHRKWEDFFARLKYVIVDEVHSYRGVFGSNVAHIFRRLRRICEHYGSKPVYMAASATIANPEILAEGLTGLPFQAIRESGAPSAGRHFFFVDPIESPYTVAMLFFIDCIKAGIRTIVFTKSRKITELIYTWTTERIPELAEKISPYRAGFLPKERREIERRLFSGELLGVISTSALELGVDIGGLDCCILCGYPGSVSSTWQRAGRAGRHGQESVVVLVAIQDALDRYSVKHADEFFARSHEAAILDPDNRNILKKHLVCAASELPLRLGEDIYDPAKMMPVIDELMEERALLPGKKGCVWFPADRRPHRGVGIRAIGERFTLVNEKGRPVGELTGGRVFSEAFPGAIYLHRGRQYRVAELDIAAKKAICAEVKVQYYTQPLSSESTEITEEKAKKTFGGISFSWGTMRITRRITGYDKKRVWDRARLSSHGLDLPDYVFETEGIWTVIDRKASDMIEAGGFDLGGTLHAVEHAAIACMPLFALCDRGDIGGLSHTLFPEFSLPAIFVYDGHEGGVGLSRRMLDVVPQWLEATLKIIGECPCTGGCPSCVQDPHCGNRNEPLDKEGAKFLLRRWIGQMQ
jgi:DEAD/DEAH box helicase domain-containing protein